MLATAQPAGLNTLYIWVAILGGLALLLGTGGLVGLIKYTKQQGLRDSRLDESADVVLGNREKGTKPLDVRFDDLTSMVTRRFDELSKLVLPNGGKSIHDTAYRAEKKADSANTRLDEHIGRSDEVHNELRRRVNQIERTK